MKILELRFKNLNSLYGEWKIDFTTPEYISNGIFAITGPTGAGKSTILDAICLALYGATPRLGKITKSSNELMSQQTGECFSEVTFQSQAGKFRCHWSQHKARKKVEGKLGESTHEIVDAETGQILESKKREVAFVIEEKTGMDFDRFTRSILLAQGGFSAFLMATPDERAPILEQITGTEIYSDISKRVHERVRAARDKLHLLQAEISGITLLSEEQEVAFNLELIKIKQKEAHISFHSQSIKKAVDWLSIIEDLNQEILALSQATMELNKEQEILQVEREKLARAQKAVELEGAYATLNALRKQQKEDSNALANVSLNLSETKALYILQEETLSIARQHSTKVKQDQKLLTPMIQKVRALDQQLIEKRKAITIIEKDYEKIADEIASKENERKSIKANLCITQEALKFVQVYLKNNAQDAWLLTQLAAIEEQFKNLASLRNVIISKKESLEDAEKRMKSTTEAVIISSNSLAEHQQIVSGIQTQIAHKKQAMKEVLGNRLLREYRAEKENLLREMAFLQKIASLESERQKLEDDKPCPLCGAKVHPYAENNMPKSDEPEKKIAYLTLLIEKVEAYEQSISELDKSAGEASNNLTVIDKLKSTALNEQYNTANLVTEILAQLATVNVESDTLKHEILKKLKVFGIKTIPDSDVNPLLIELQKKQSLWNEQQQQQLAYEKQIFELESELKPFDAIIDTYKKSLRERQDTLKAANQDYDMISIERNNLFGTKKTDDEEASLEKAMTDAEQSEKRAQDERDKIKQVFDAFNVRIETLRAQICNRAIELDVSETAFVDALKNEGFRDEDTFIINLRSVDERNRLSHRLKVFDNKKTTLEHKLNDRKERLAIERDKNMTESTVDELRPDLLEAEENLKKIRDEVATLTVDLKNQKINKQRVQEKQHFIEAQKIECTRLEYLHSLIGSSDGKKYRNFAQGLTFELMVSHANKQLEKMTDRYLLIRDDMQPLELNVVDNYQAGEVRTTKNLSGGESFIVSLSLALGLSKMSSQKVRVDSLFLDEGFGTLDDEALETALETLGELQQDGKVIGIISHVLALKERISTQINVQPVTGGRSAIIGPGCEKIG